eukprot:scaffold27923_cov20-Tisochrysis_lutea.AAC.3
MPPGLGQAHCMICCSQKSRVEQSRSLMPDLKDKVRARAQSRNHHTAADQKKQPMLACTLASLKLRMHIPRGTYITAQKYCFLPCTVTA